MARGRTQFKLDKLSHILPQSRVKCPQHFASQPIMNKLSLSLDVHQACRLQFLHMVRECCRADADASQYRATLQPSTLLAQPRKDLVAPRITKRPRNRLHLVLT